MTKRSNVYRLFSRPNTVRARVAVSSGSIRRDDTDPGEGGSSSSLPTMISTVTSSASSFRAISSIRARWLSSIHCLKNLCGVATKRTQPRLEHLLAHLAPQLGEDLFPGLRGHGAIPRRRCFIDGKVAEKRSVPGRFARRKRKSCQHVIPQVWITLNPL